LREEAGRLDLIQPLPEGRNEELDEKTYLRCQRRADRSGSAISGDGKWIVKRCLFSSLRRYISYQHTSHQLTYYYAVAKDLGASITRLPISKFASGEKKNNIPYVQYCTQQPVN